MKKIILTILFIFLSIVKVDAEIKTIDMNNWKFKTITWFSDQDKNVVVSKFTNNDKYGFCLEPTQKYNPLGDDYYKEKYSNDKIFNIVKAYDEIGKKDDNYYIAAQIMIWEETSNIKYTFKNNDYSEYINDLNKCIKKYNSKLLLVNSNNDDDNLIESPISKISSIENDYSNYEISGDGIEIISNDTNGLKYKILDDDPELKTLTLTPKYDPKDYQYTYTSQTYQDIYSFEGTYEIPKTLYLNFKGINIPEYIDINYSKKDKSSNPIKDAQFTLYEIDSDNADTQLIFIQIDNNINLYEAILDDSSLYNDLRIETSERYEIYINNGIINTNELGYFPYKIYDNNQLIKLGIVYVCDDSDLTDSYYKKVNVSTYYSGYSFDTDVNTISDVEKGKKYYFCESEPAKGYVYTQSPCTILDTNTYDGEVLEFVNDTRTYTLKLMKQNPYDVLLDGAKFKITYLEDDKTKDIYLTTGYLSIKRNDNNKYLIYKHENENEVNVIEFIDDLFETNNVKQGKYYYYQSNSNLVDYSKLNDEYAIVVKGGFAIENMPYSSSITIEEIQAPQGYMIEEPIYHISPNISFSEITFRNYRVNEFYIMPKKKYKIVKTCIGD